MKDSNTNWPTFEFNVEGFEQLRTFGNEIDNIEEKVDFYNYQIQRYDEQHSPYAGPAGIDIDLLLSLERDYWNYITKLEENIKTPKRQKGDSFSDQSWAREVFNTCVLKIYFQKWELFDYDIGRIKEHAKEVGSIANQVFYLRFVFKEFKIQTSCYPNSYTKQRTGNFESKVLQRLKYLEKKLTSKKKDERKTALLDNNQELEDKLKRQEEALSKQENVLLSLKNKIKSMQDQEITTDPQTIKNLESEIEELKSKNEKLQKDKEQTNRELEISHNKIKLYKKKSLESKYIKDENELKKIIDQTRKINGKHNYAAIGRILGCNHETAKRHINRMNLLNY